MLILTRLGRKAEADAELRVLERLRKDQAEFDRIGDGVARLPARPRAPLRRGALADDPRP